MLHFIDSQQLLENNLEKIYNLSHFSIDTESSGLDPYQHKLLLLQLGTLENQFVIDCRKVNIEPLKYLLETSNKPKIFINAKFDYKFIKKGFGIEIENNIIDCMLCEKIFLAGLVYPQASGYFAMDDLVRKYCKQEIVKDIRHSFINHTGDFTEKQLEYAKDDIIWPIKIWQEQKKEVEKRNLWEVFRLECDAIPAFGDIELNGIYLNADEWMKLHNRNVIKLQDVENKLRKRFSVGQSDLFNLCPINFDSSEQLQKLLNKMGYNIPNTLEMSLLTLPDEIGKPLIEYRKLSKAISSFGENYLQFINPVTKRIHASVNSIGAATGRVSFSRPAMQQIPVDDEYRNCFQAENENVLSMTDHTGQELRIITEIVNEPSWVSVLSKDNDLHSYVGSLLFETEVSKTKNKKLRSLAKNMIFMLAYGGGVNKVIMFHNQAGIPCDKEKGLHVLNKFFTLFPRVKETLDNIGNNAVENGVSTTLGNRPRYFNYEKWSEGKNWRERNRIKAKIIRDGKNHSIQGSGVDILKKGMVVLRKRIKKYGLKCKHIHVIHDENIIEHMDDAENNVYHVEQAMLLAQEYYQMSVPAGVESCISKLWKK